MSSGEQVIHSIVLSHAVVRVAEKELCSGSMEVRWELGPTWEVPFAGKLQILYTQDLENLIKTVHRRIKGFGVSGLRRDAFLIIEC